PEDGVVSPPRRAPRMPSPLDVEPAVTPRPEVAPRQGVALPLREQARPLLREIESEPPPEPAESVVWGMPTDSVAAVASSASVPEWEMPPAPPPNGAPPEARGEFEFVELKVQLGEPATPISFEKFAAKLKKNRADLVAKHNCKGVRFSVYEKDGKATIKASAIR